MYTLPAYTGDASVLCVLGWEEASGESFRSTTGVYSRPSQLFINKIMYIRLLSVVCRVSSVLMFYVDEKLRVRLVNGPVNGPN